MTTDRELEVSYQVTRFNLPTGAPFEGFRHRFEGTVPQVPVNEVMALVKEQAPWSDMLTLIKQSAPLGFLLYGSNDVTPVTRLAGDSSSAVSYLMGNHTIMEKMFRHSPAVVNYAPLHLALWGTDPEVESFLTFDRPSDQFGSFGSPDVLGIGRELDGLMIRLLKHLDLPVPGGLTE